MLEALAAILKAMVYCGVLSCAGIVFAEATLRAPPDIAGMALRIVRRTAVLTVVASVLSALVLIVRLGGQWNEVTLSAVFMSGSGAATGFQLAGAGLLLASFTVSSDRAMRVSNAAVMTLSFAFSGHAAAEGLFEGLLAFIHASLAAWWIGSLYVLRHSCVRLKPVLAARLVRRFSVIALGLVGALVLAGVLLVLVLVPFASLPALSPYEQILAVKLALAAALIGAATYNRFRLTPRLLNGDPTTTSALRRMIDVELALIGLVVVATSVLTTYTSPS